MSELIQKNDNHATIRWKLLTGASALVLTAYVSSASLAAEDSDRPQIWLELGGAFSRLQDAQEIYAPAFVALTPAPFTSPQKAERPPLYVLDETASLRFQPEDSDWNFSASINYGRAGSGKHVHHQSYPGPISYYIKNLRKGTTRYFPVYPGAERFTDATVKQSENHMIVDFQVGKDVGLGLFGPHGSSSLNAGVRFAQFRSKTRASLTEDPDWHTSTYLVTIGTPPRLIIQHVYQVHHSFAGSFQADRSFHGFGPSLSWNSSLPFAGNPQDGALTLDWGLNAALLFGRQKATTQHQSKAQYTNFGYPTIKTHSEHVHPQQTRSHNIMVPNAGGFAGLSFRYVDAKVSLGYRGDFFFGAIDGGIDARKNEARGFYGPYASISVGLGD